MIGRPALRSLSIYGSVALFSLLFAISAARPLHVDSMDFAAAAEATLHTGKPVYYRGEQYRAALGLYHPPLYMYVLAGWFGVFGAGPAQARLFGAVCALLHGWICLLLLGTLLGKAVAARAAPWFWPIFLLGAFTLQTAAILDIDSTIYGPLLILVIWSVVRVTWADGERRAEPLRTTDYLLPVILLALSMWAKLTSVWLVIPLIILLLVHRLGWIRAVLTGSAFAIGGLTLFLATYYLYGWLLHLDISYTFRFLWVSLTTRGSTGKHGLSNIFHDHANNLWFMIIFMVLWTGLVPWIGAAFASLRLLYAGKFDRRYLHLAFIVLYALAGVVYYCAQQKTFAASPFKYTFIYWGLIIAALSVLIGEVPIRSGKLITIAFAIALTAAFVIGARYVRDLMPLNGLITRRDYAPLLIPAGLVIVGLLARNGALRYLGQASLILGILFYVGMETGVCLSQTRANYSTTYDYGQLGFEDAAAYIKNHTTPSQAIVSMKDLAYAAQRRFYENYPAIYGSPEATQIVETAIASGAATLAVFTEGRGQDELVINPPLRLWVEQHCTQVASFGNYRIYRLTFSPATDSQSGDREAPLHRSDNSGKRSDPRDSAQ